MQTNIFKQKLLERARMIGTHIQLPVPEHAEIMGLAGFDYIWVDTEHSPIDERTLLHCVNLIKMRGLSSVIVRVPVNDFNRTKKVLEIWPDGIVFPMINTKEQALEAVRSTLYPPFGTRGFGPMRAVEYGNQDVGEYIEKGVFDLARLMQVETEEAVANLPEILTVPDIDGFIIGPCDLAASVGELGKWEQPRTMALIRRTAELLRSAGKSFGVSIGDASPELSDFYFGIGANLISSGVDYGYLLGGAKEMKDRLDRARDRAQTAEEGR